MNYENFVLNGRSKFSSHRYRARRVDVPSWGIPDSDCAQGWSGCVGRNQSAASWRRYAPILPALWFR